MGNRPKINLGFVLLIALTMAAMISSCKKDVVNRGLDATQLVAGRLDGTWANPADIVVPENVSTGVFGSMRLVFTTDDAGKPLQFIAKECPIVFSPMAGEWSVSGTEDGAKVTLTGVAPVDELDVTVSSTTLRISFYMGWENTDTGETGEGEFGVTLTRQ